MGFFDKLFGGGKPAKPSAVAAAAEKGAVCAPVSGTVEVTSNVSDPMFAQEMMGKTVAIWPSDGNVFAPITGSITAAMPQKKSGLIICVGLMRDSLGKLLAVLIWLHSTE